MALHFPLLENFSAVEHSRRSEQPSDPAGKGPVPVERSGPNPATEKRSAQEGIQEKTYRTLGLLALGARRLLLGYRVQRTRNRGIQPSTY